MYRSSESDRVHAIVREAVLLSQSPGYQERLKQERLVLLEKRLDSLTREIVSNIRDYHKVVRFINELKNSNEESSHDW
jgi:hypothetical protein